MILGACIVGHTLRRTPAAKTCDTELNAVCFRVAVESTGGIAMAIGIRAATVAAVMASATFMNAHACGPQSDCVVGERTYRIALPDGEGPFGAVVYMHGYRGTADGAMNNKGLRDMARNLGVALIAAKSGGEDWLIRNAPRKGFADDSRELGYFDAVLEDAAARFPLDRDRLLATGFSAGGMMTWTLACHRSEAFRAFAPIAGTFWAPIPDTCPGGPVNLVHINGTADTIVPIEGRPIADTHQGNARSAVAMFAREENYAPLAPAAAGADLGLECAAAAGPLDTELAFCTHGGGHILRPEWIAWAWRKFVE